MTSPTGSGRPTILRLVVMRVKPMLPRPIPRHQYRTGTRPTSAGPFHEPPNQRCARDDLDKLGQLADELEAEAFTDKLNEHARCQRPRSSEDRRQPDDRRASCRPRRWGKGDRKVRHIAGTEAKAYASSPSSAFASLRSAVSNPSVNAP
jgi:hypothetical protein